MGIYDREYYRGEDASQFTFGGRTMVTNLLIINVVVFVLDALTQGEVRSGIGRTVSSPVLDFLALRPRNLVEPWNWWRLLTTGFAHDGPSHIFANMLGLFFFGRPIEQVYGSRKFLYMYLSAILLGSLVWAVANFATNPNAMLVGASGAVTCVVLLFCLHFPKQTVYLFMVLPIPAWVLGVVLILSDVAGHLTGSGNVAYAVHLTGAAYGYFFLRTQRTLFDWLAPGWLNQFKRKFTGPRLKIHKPERRTRAAAKKVDDGIDRQADEVLAKLHQQGESSLTARERRILEEYSRRMKQKHR